MKETKYWVTFYTPNILVADTWNVEYDKLPEPNSVEFPENAYAFVIYKREDIVEGETRYRGETEQVGKMYYHPDSEIKKFEEIPDCQPNEILRKNMECNNWDAVIYTRWGNWAQPYDKEEVEIL